jgi:hypothetical protein
MIAISPVLFQAGGDYQVELIKNGTGEVNAVKISWSDGWTEVINRTK